MGPVWIVLLVLSTAHKGFSACTVSEDGSRNVTCRVSGCGNGGAGKVLEWVVSTLPEGFPITCAAGECGGSLIKAFPTTITGSGGSYTSTLTLKGDARTNQQFIDLGLDFERKLTCTPKGTCSIVSPPVDCPKVEFYALSEDTVCTATEQPDSGEIESVLVTCTSGKIYPEGKCKIYWSTDDGQKGDIPSNEITTTNTETGETPTYYRTECSTTLPVSALGEGTHTFSGKIYPDVAGGSSLVADNVEADKQVALSFPVVDYSCFTQYKVVDGRTYFIGKSASCTCSLTSEGRPKGRAAWFDVNAEMLSNPDGSVTFSYGPFNPSYTCKGTSALGPKDGPTITPLFAFIDENTVQSSASSNPINLCPGNNDQATITCQVAKANANPEPKLSLYVNGTSRAGSIKNTQTDYISEYPLESVGGGNVSVYCEAASNIFQDQRQQSQSVTVTFNKPPTGPPEVRALSQRVSGTDAENTLTLSAGYTGDITCRTDGGFPPATISTFSCTGILSATSTGNPSATLSFSESQLTSDMDGATCSCTADQHASGCYDNRQTQFSLNVRYKPEISSFTASSVEVDEGGTTSLSCTGKGNPSPTLSLTRERKEDTLERDITAASKTVSFTHSTEALGCLDTDVYNCVATNDEGTSTKSVTVNVKCKPHLAQDPNVDAVLGQTHEVRVQIYGYPTPTVLDLTKADGSKASESVEYRASQPPYGEVVVTFENLVAENFRSNYTLTVGNGIGERLTYSFRLNQVSALAPKSGGGGDSGVIIGVVVAVVVIIVLVAAAVFIILWRKRRVPCLPHKGSEADNSNSKVQSNPMYGSSNDALDSRNSIRLNGTQGEDNYGYNTAA